MTRKNRTEIFSKITVIALGVICLILAAGLIGAIAIYNPMISDLQSKVVNNESTIAELNSQIASLNSTTSSLNSQVASLTISLNQSNTNLSALQQQLTDCYGILTLSKHGYLVNSVQTIQTTGNVTSLWTGTLDYAGYVIFQVQSSSNTTCKSCLHIV